MLLQRLNDAFRARTIGAALAGAVTLASFAGAAGAQDQLASAASFASQIPIEVVDQREAWLASKENGGTLVIWYDARHHKDAVVEMRGLKEEFGLRNVTIKAGRTDGMFVLIGNGRTNPHKFSLSDARSGALGGEALMYAKMRNIASLDENVEQVEGQEQPGQDLT